MASSTPTGRRLQFLVKGIIVMPNSDESVITFPVGGIFGVARLATKLNELLKRGQIGPWHVGHWIDFKHTAIRINFLTTTDGEVAKRSCVDAY
jgi:hypothetical protein